MDRDTAILLSILRFNNDRSPDILILNTLISRKFLLKVNTIIQYNKYPMLVTRSEFRKNVLNTR